MSWTDERVELLKKLWSDGLSASQIAAELGGITRNAVIGKVHRLGLSGRAKSASSASPRPRKARTSTHMLRIAFPPGPRKRGAGKVIEIFHPANENPCSMQRRQNMLRPGDKIDWIPAVVSNMMENYELLRRGGVGHAAAVRETINESVAGPASIREFRKRLKEKRNPGATDQAASLYESFHGQSPKEVLEMQESDAARHTYTALGDLVELVIDAPAGKVKIGFDQADAVKVASAPGGKQLYLIGGNQNIDSQLGSFGSDPGKDFVELGAATQITYRARKSMDDFKLVDYYHNLGEETNEPPYAFYDRLKRRIFLAGGRYRVEAPGIIN